MKLTTSEQGYETPFIYTNSGIFYLDHPIFHIEDIAHSLSLLCRFNGHLRRFYSVAEHSLLVAKLMDFLELGDPFEGLMHDATEAYVSDVPSPFKRQLPDWQRLDAKLEVAMRQQFGLPETKSEGCKEADWIALFIEAMCLQEGGGHLFEDPHGFRNKAAHLLSTSPHLWYPEAREPDYVQRQFLTAFDRLRLGHGHG